ncbi:hypothetical protein NEMBOFW57_004288 [Staphylotrichum longicolle]|uniref:MACPF-like domain-containing protein n=1 Tax=Staphylotrichum longicolle TaxID=669026 RepID=A0AAD4FBG0_9PEZI|nr:hypothetical protein NEMBOFW57_004288 [Staphylotrichum longicolle]
MIKSNNVRAAKARAPAGKPVPSAAAGTQQRKASAPAAPIKQQPKATPQPVNSRAPPPKKAPLRAPSPDPVSGDESGPDWEDDDDVETGDHHVASDSSPTPHGPGVLVKVVALSASEGVLSQMPITNLEFASPNRNSFLSETKLAHVRNKLEGVVRKGATFTFCTDEGAVASSEDISLQAYAKTLGEDAFSEDGLFHVFIVASNEPTATQEEVLLKPPFQIKFIQMGENPSEALNTGSLHSSAFRGKDPSSLPMGELRRMIGKMSTSPKMHTFCSVDGSAAGDELTLSQYLGLDKEGVREQEATPSILVRYRKTDARVSAPEAASKFHGASAEVLAAMEQLRPDLTIKDHSAEEFKVDKTGFKVQEELDASQFAATDASPAKFTSQMDESDWDAVLRNCSLLYGWKINKKTNQIERATTPAFRLKNKAPVPTPASPPPPAAVTAPTSSEPKAIENGLSSTGGSDNGSDIGSVSGRNPDTPTTSISPGAEDAVASTQPARELALTAEDIAGTIPAKLGAIPSFVVNDQSRIQITTVSSEFQESMAKNHFDSTSVEASVSGGYAGFSAGVSAGYASENSSKNVQTNKTFSKRMIGNYMFPRVSVFLRPEDLEPTPELKQALLLTTKIVTGDQNTTETEEKEAFKASVGVAFSTPIGVGGSVKSSHENSDSKATFKSQTNTSEALTFEATGGNSILAANPPAWSNSVADFNNWRVVNQTELTPIVDAIAAMTGFGEVKSWFLSAVPKLSQYFVVPESRVLHVRFKVAAQNSSFNHITGRPEEQAYLGVDPDRPPKPIQMSLERLAPETDIHEHVRGTWFWKTVDLTYTTRQVDVHRTDAMFFPHSVQAPVLMFPGGKEVGTTQDPKLMQTVWRLEVAEGYSLGPNCLVCIKSCAPVRSSSKSAPQPAELALTVYRNAQGAFMPAITSTDEPCYWRLRRASDMSPLTNLSVATKQESFKHGEDFRLTWSFADQSGGYRDYYHDMPYPRFEKSDDNSGISLVLSRLHLGARRPALQDPPTKEEGPGPDKEVNYNLFDLTFRMDCVGNDGVGDAADFMNVITEAHEERRETHTWDGNGGNPYGLVPFGSPAAMLAGVLLGPAALPVAGMAAILNGIIGF